MTKFKCDCCDKYMWSKTIGFYNDGEEIVVALEKYFADPFAGLGPTFIATNIIVQPEDICQCTDSMRAAVRKLHEKVRMLETTDNYCNIYIAGIICIVVLGALIGMGLEHYFGLIQ